MSDGMAGAAPVRVGVVGCGDVAHRAYAEALRTLGDRAALVAAADRDAARAESFANAVGARDAACHADVAELLAGGGVDALINLTPPAEHARVTAAALDAGVHVLSEKPLASSPDEGLALRDRARQRGALLLAAPAVMATPRFERLRGLVRSGELGDVLFATTQVASLGPLAMTDYEGDAAAFYAPDVGPLVDLGLYGLHALTGVLGPAREVRAWGSTRLPIRRPPRGGSSIALQTPDVVTVELVLDSGARVLLIASYASRGSRAPFVEIHGSDRSVSVPAERWLDPLGPLWVTGERRWEPVAVTGDRRIRHLLHAGAAHLIDCVRGTADPVLTAEHACHALEIVAAAREAARTETAIELRTSF